MKSLMLIGLAAFAATAAPAQADRRGDQYDAYQARQDGRVLSLRAIEARVLPRMAGADYLGPEFDPGTAVYRLKFMRGGRVIWVDVDGRTGGVIGRAGN